jgi:hypothetical protein
MEHAVFFMLLEQVMAQVWLLTSQSSFAFSTKKASVMYMTTMDYSRMLLHRGKRQVTNYPSMRMTCIGQYNRKYLLEKV